MTAYQKYAKLEVLRSEIKNAPYNPRTISDAARTRLKAKIREVGLVNAPVFNVRTGNLVSGHQRLAIIDSLERKQDYLIAVDAVDVDEKTEKELVIFLNNSQSMGEWDFPKLEEILRSEEVDLNLVGFDEVGLQLILGEGALEYQEAPAIQMTVEEIKRIKETKKKHREADREKHREDFYLVVVFATAKERMAFLNQYGGTYDERYISGTDLAARLGIDLKAQEVDVAKEVAHG